MTDLFISHSSDDQEIADELCSALEDRGFSCWIAPRDIEPGAEYSQCLHTSILNARLFLLVLSTNAGNSRHVRREVELAERNNIKILPLRIENKISFGDALDYYVSTIQFNDAFERPLGPSIEKLENLLQKMLGDPENKKRWKELGGHLSERYGIERPRALLSIDGVGIRCITTLEILNKIEFILAKQSLDHKEFRLCNYFDYIAGAGTGALIAIALALGLRISQIQEFFYNSASAIFGKEVYPFQFQFLSPKFSNSDSLDKYLKYLVGEKTNLLPDNLKCLLMVLVRRQITHIPWPITSNPLAKYNDRSRADCNLYIPLLSLARASIKGSPWADPEIIRWGPDNSKHSYVFNDGTYTTLNNPAYQLYYMATDHAYRLNWKRGVRKLFLVSVGEAMGSGYFPSSEDDALLKSVLANSNLDQDFKCKTIGKCIYGYHLPNLEKEQSFPPDETGDSFTYIRYGFDCSEESLYEFDHLSKLDIEIGPDCKVSIDEAITILGDFGQMQADRHVRFEHFDSVRIPI